ncbi:YciI family protein [Stackebrandtia nassauensis]|uniref:YCII-related protein n=1 Tax=Stackebrandtia nassauensis (strain DSM 44728 / CIP 108903 / NRRL B-16338 / NBRC 102104 / LLR-40K-21) TaxID=446470 RepID=D3PY85_STANL|nr:YciI family protein [Stackebrandtia nassauensis]ADD41452.1 YCII-related protein [Stackebrandtia nassauensis DSM 44728]
MKHYLLTMYQPQGEIPPPEVLDPIMAELGELAQEMRDAGAWVFGNGLHDPSTATVLHYKNDELVTTDGPYIEGKEYIGGFDIIRAADLDAALEWGRKLARIVGLPIEVRPFQGEVE